jgi:hypothetical protein
MAHEFVWNVQRDAELAAALSRDWLTMLQLVSQIVLLEDRPRTDFFSAGYTLTG